MAQNKNAQLRYLVIDRCLRNTGRRYTISDLAEECGEALREDGVKRYAVSDRQIRKDIDFLMSNPNYHAPIEKAYDGHKVYYFYDDPSFSISKMPLSENEVAKMREAFNLLSRFRGMPQCGWIEEIVTQLESKLLINSESTDTIIGFEEPLRWESVQYLESIFNAILNRTALLIDYAPFDKTPIKWKISPYYIKQYNNRWFLFGQNNDEPNLGLTNIPLDRIASITPLSDDYIPNTQYDFNEYFDDVIGVTIPSSAKPEKITFKMSPMRAHHVRTKPLHASQKHLQSIDPYTFEITVMPNPELYALLLSFGADLEVLSPESVRAEIRHRIEMMNNIYKTEKSLERHGNKEV